MLNRHLICIQVILILVTTAHSQEIRYSEDAETKFAAALSHFKEQKFNEAA